ncbi:MAG: hypothetical protein HC874_31565 [Richelia sp. SL_2_1]|nr:hypothetical protein [Richelia sp. SL_2_1]
MNKTPKYLHITLVFEDDKLNQSSLINIDGSKSVYIDNIPEFIESKIETINGKAKPTIIKRNIFAIVVDYGEEGISLDDFNKSTSSNKE